MNVNDYVDYINSITLCPPYPKGGFTGVYLGELATRLSDVSPTALKLFILVASDIGQYGQTKRSRKEFNQALGISMDRARMSKLFKELSDAKWTTSFGKYITVNPFIVIPKVPNPKLKAAIQEAWSQMVEYV